MCYVTVVVLLPVIPWDFSSVKSLIIIECPTNIKRNFASNQTGTRSFVRQKNNSRKTPVAFNEITSKRQDKAPATTHPGDDAAPVIIEIAKS